MGGKWHSSQNIFTPHAHARAGVCERCWCPYILYAFTDGCILESAVELTMVLWTLIQESLLITLPEGPKLFSV